MAARNTLRIEGGSLIVIPKGWDKLWGVRRRLAVPLSTITKVSVESDSHHVPTGWRGPGLDAFGKLVGTFHPRGERHYWNYSGAGDALSIRLDGSEHFYQLYLSVDDAQEAKSLISKAMGALTIK